MAKTKILKSKFVRLIIYHHVGHEILKKKQYILFVISTYISRVNGENVREIAKNANFKMQISEANERSSCRA